MLQQLILWRKLSLPCTQGHLKAQCVTLWELSCVEHTNGSTSVKTDICHYIAVSRFDAASYTILSKSGPFWFSHDSADININNERNTVPTVSQHI